LGTTLIGDLGPKLNPSLDVDKEVRPHGLLRIMSCPPLFCNHVLSIFFLFCLIWRCSDKLV